MSGFWSVLVWSELPTEIFYLPIFYGMFFSVWIQLYEMATPLNIVRYASQIRVTLKRRSALECSLLVKLTLGTGYFCCSFLSPVSVMLFVVIFLVIFLCRYFQNTTRDILKYFRSFPNDKFRCCYVVQPRFFEDLTYFNVDSIEIGMDKMYYR